MDYNLFGSFSDQRQGRDNHCSGFALGAILSGMKQVALDGHAIYEQLQSLSPHPQLLKNSYSFWNFTGELYTPSMQKIEGKMVLPSSIIAMLPVLLPVKYQFTIYCDTEKWESSLSRFVSDYGININIGDVAREQVAEIQKLISPKIVEPLDKFPESAYDYSMMLISDGVHWVAQARNGDGYNPSKGITESVNWECSGFAIAFW